MLILVIIQKLFCEQNVKATSIEENRGIIFNEIEQDYNMCVDEELITKRLKLLILRDQEELEFKNLRFVPLKEREISKDIFKVITFILCPNFVLLWPLKYLHKHP